MDAKVKELFEKMKVTAGVAAEAAGKAAQTAGKKAGELVENTKINLKILDLNAEIEIAYKAIGQMVYRTHAGEDVSSEEVDRQIALIEEKQAAIGELKEKLAASRHTVKCVNCGKDCDKGDDFCRACGAQL